MALSFGFLDIVDSFHDRVSYDHVLVIRDESDFWKLSEREQEDFLHRIGAKKAVKLNTVIAVA